MFEPYSLHKYLYCEGSPVGNWDPSGELTLLEVSSIIAITAIVLENALHVYASFLGAWQETITWTGHVICFTISMPSPLPFAPAIGIHSAYFISESVNGKVGRGKYLIIVAGVTVSFPYLFVGVSFFDTQLETPGMLGPNPGVLVGLVSWISVTLVLIKGGAGNIVQMGFGRTKRGKEVGTAEGPIDIAGDVMGGISFKLSGN